MGKAVRAVLGVAGAMVFFFGVYILPFGTDFYLYIFVHKIFHGNWLQGSIAANLVALLMIAIGAVMLYKAGKSPIPRERKKKPKRKKKSEVYRL